MVQTESSRDSTEDVRMQLVPQRRSERRPIRNERVCIRLALLVLRTVLRNKSRLHVFLDVTVGAYISDV